MSRRGILLALLGVVCYLGFLIATLPAAQVWGWVGERLPVRAFGLSGTVWDGRAAVLQQEHRRLQNLHWQLDALPLLLGRARVDLQAEADNGRLRGLVTASRQSVLGDEVKLDMPAPDLLQWLGVNLPVKVAGHFEAFLQHFEVHQGQLTDAAGILNWNNAELNLGRPLALGNVALRLEPGDGAIIGKLVNQDSPLSLDGDLRLAPDGKFTLDLSARMAADASEEARKTLQMIGVPADGSPMRARLSGALDGTGMSLRPLNN